MRMGLSRLFAMLIFKNFSFPESLGVDGRKRKKIRSVYQPIRKKQGKCR